MNNPEIKIPNQLANERFIILKNASKEPLNKWSSPENQLGAEEAARYTEMGYNYGVLYKTDLSVLDMDNITADSTKKTLEALPTTYTVSTGRGLHLYYRIKESTIPSDYRQKKIILFTDADKKTDMGDIRLPKSPFYNVGPGSIHPLTKKPYEPVTDVEIAALDFAEIFDVLEEYAGFNEPTKSANAARENGAKIGRNYRLESWEDYGVDVSDFLYPLNAHVRDGEIEGIHPIHGSTTGTNLVVSGDRSMWYCRRCGSGGGWVKALMVARGIIDCCDARPERKITPDEWTGFEKVLMREYPEVYEKRMRAMLKKGGRI